MFLKSNFFLFLTLYLLFSLKIFAADPVKKIAIVGDLQKTSPWEFLLGREENDAERAKVVQAIANEHAGMIIFLGDMVYDGSDKNQWTEFSNLIKPIKKQNVPIYPVLGNHEYWGDYKRGLKNVSNLFPVFKKKHWYTVVNNGMAFIFLDSNSSKYSTSDWDEQRHWFEALMKQYDEDPNVLGVFVFLHHPPYTNSIITGDEIPVQEAICPEFTKSKKGMILFSGHAHTFEKFYINNKYFIVSGGGGGPRVLLKTGLEYHHDLCTMPSPRPFHYITLEREDNGVRLTVKGINKGGTKFYDIDKFTLYFHY